MQSRGASPQAYWMSVKAAQRWGCAKRAFCGVCFLMPGGLSARLLFVGRGAARGRGTPPPTGRNGFPRQRHGADRVVRPYKAKQEPCETGRRGRRPLRNHKGCVQRGGQGRPPLQGKTGTAQNGTSRAACHTNRRGAARTAKFRNFFFPLSASAGLRRLYSDDTGRPPVL